MLPVLQVIGLGLSAASSAVRPTPRAETTLSRSCGRPGLAARSGVSTLVRMFLLIRR